MRSHLVEESKGTEPPVADEEDPTRETIVADRIVTVVPVQVLHPFRSALDVFPKVVDLTREGRTELPVELDGKLTFILKGREVTTNLEIAQDGPWNELRIVVDDLKALAPMFDEPFTDAEYELVASMPLRTPRLLRIRDDAASTAKRAYEGDETIPEDAYRHVLWSFLLTKAFGPDVAMRVTDAHEQGDWDSTDADREMDLNNNSIGRRYAAEGAERADILAEAARRPFGYPQRRVRVRHETASPVGLAAYGNIPTSTRKSFCKKLRPSRSGYCIFDLSLRVTSTRFFTALHSSVSFTL